MKIFYPRDFLTRSLLKSKQLFHSVECIDPEIFPPSIVIGTTNFCNLKCSMCGHRLMTRKKGSMEMPVFRKLVEEIAKENKNARVWLSFFGEPLILKYKLYTMISYAKKKGLKKILLNTNGMLLDEKAIYNLIVSGLDELVIGIDAFTPETYSQLRVGGNYERVKENTILAIKMVQESLGKKPKIIVQFIETRENEKELEDFKNYWRNQGAILKVRTKVSWTGDVDTKKLTFVTRYPCYWIIRLQKLMPHWPG